MTENFSQLVAAVMARSPLQKKRLQRHLAAMDATFFAEAEEFARSYSAYLSHCDIPLSYAVEAYIAMCNSMLKYQVDFIKTGAYPARGCRQVQQQIYQDPEQMRAYLIALALSQFLWPSHYRSYRFFSKAIATAAVKVRHYLEIGPGHGLLLNRAIACLPATAGVTVVDISPVAMAVTRSISKYFWPHRGDINYQIGDILDLSLGQCYDFITMGEVLEHVSTPASLLAKLADLLAPDGAAFVSTCVNCPAIDHLYQFPSIDAIRALIAAAGLIIRAEEVLPVEDLPLDQAMARKMTVNYCSLLQRKENGEIREHRHR